MSDGVVVEVVVVVVAEGVVLLGLVAGPSVVPSVVLAVLDSLGCPG